MTQTLLNNISKLTDYSEKFFSKNTIIEEFINKFSGTYIYVNGSLVYISYISVDKCSFISKVGSFNIKMEEECHLELFLPKTGLYKYKESLFYLSRLPKKQFFKSFLLNRNYDLEPLFGNYPVIDPLFLSSMEYLGTYTIFNDTCWIFNTMVGTKISINKVIYIKPLHNIYIPDIKLLWKPYKISPN